VLGPGARHVRPRVLARCSAPASVRVGRGPTATRLHVQREGTGEPLLWITGFAISSEIFSPVIDSYAAEFDCVRYDNRGAGRSPRPGASRRSPSSRATPSG
jgi:pimeloyl-ACP methyl ester carboxylesterase